MTTPNPDYGPPDIVSGSLLTSADALVLKPGVR